ncbi:MAG: cytosol aminopeptidase, partial [Chlorobiaceae bacterium]|nr:cytosol aminopeptidase [Chlorobiaceae bacterium]
MKLSVTADAIEKIAADLLALPVSKSALEKDSAEILSGLGLASGVLKDFKAEAGEIALLYSSGGKCAAARIALLGIGEGKSLDDWRKAAGALASKAVDL